LFINIEESLFIGISLRNYIQSLLTFVTPSKSNQVSVIFVLIGFSLVVALGFLAAFIWSVRNGQYEDDYTPSVRILFEDDLPAAEKDTTKPADQKSFAKDPPLIKKEPKT
jgi:cbb3-type cytochrome oxidase maturation protein